MSEEPTYEYIKGQGWVVAPPCETVSGVIGKWHVVLMRRRPVKGEFFFTDGCSLEQTFENLKGYRAFENEYVGDEFPVARTDWDLINATLVMLLKPVDL